MPLNPSLILGVELNYKPAIQQAIAFSKSIPPVKLNIDDGGFTRSLGRISGAADHFNQSLAASNARVLAFGASVGIIYGIEQAFIATAKAAINVEKALADINVILNLSSGGLKGFSRELFAVASLTSQSFDNATKAAVEFSRQGLGVQETLKRSRDALILTRLSNLDVLSSVESLTAGVNSFGQTLISTTELINKLANVDAAFAVSAGDLAEAIKRVGSTAQDAGVDIDELLALVTAAQQTTARGGAVIGNALKTIFTKVQRPEVLEQLDLLGVAIKDISGNVLPATKILESLANQFDKLGQSQRSQIGELVGGVYQINVLKAALSDLSKENSIYQQALEKSKGSTNQAIERNEKLNETLSSLIQRTANSAKEFGANVGNSAINPLLKGVLSRVNSALTSANETDSQNVGAKIGKGVVEGIGQFISGPGFAIITVVLGKLVGQFLKFGSDSLKAFLNINQAAHQQKEIEKLINTELFTQENLRNKLFSGQLSAVEIETQILGIIREQVALKQAAVNLAPTVSKGITQAGYNLTANRKDNTYAFKKTASSGLIPRGSAEDEIKGAYEGGYTPGQVKTMTVPGIGPVYYNTKEIIRDFGFQQPAIMPPPESKAGREYKTNFMDKHGFNPYVSKGIVPNFAPIGRNPESFVKKAKYIYNKLNLKSPYNIPEEQLIAQYGEKYYLHPDFDNLVKQNRNNTQNFDFFLKKGVLRGSVDYQSLRDVNSARFLIEPYYKKLGSDIDNFGQLTTLPKKLYHVTSNFEEFNKTKVLKSRKELQMGAGTGLGGGDDTTISLTDDFKVARGIQRSMVELSSLLSGKKSVTTLVERAKKGFRAEKPFIETFHNYVKSSIGQDAADLLLSNPKMLDRKEPHVIKSIFDAYSWAQEGAGGYLNPLFFNSDYSKISKLSKNDIKVLEFSPKKEQQLGLKLGALKEYRIHEGKQLKLTNVYSKGLIPNSIPNFAKLLGEGQYGSFYDLEKTINGIPIGEKRFHNDTNLDDITKEFLISHKLNNIQLPQLFTAPKIFDKSLKDVLKKRSIIKEVVKGSTGFNFVKNLDKPEDMIFMSKLISGHGFHSSYLEKYADSEFAKHYIVPSDLHGGNIILNEKFKQEMFNILSRKQSFENNVLRQGKLREYFNNIGKSGAKLSLIDPGNFSFSKGLVPNFNKLIGTGLYGRFYDLETKIDNVPIGEKRFRGYVHNKDIEREYRVSKQLTQLQLPSSIAAPKIFNTLDDALKRRAIVKELVLGKTIGNFFHQLLGNPYSDGRLIANDIFRELPHYTQSTLEQHNITSNDLHGENIILNEKFQNEILEVINKPNNYPDIVGRKSIRDYLNNIGNRGSKAYLIDPGLFETKNSKVSRSSNSSYMFKGMVPNFATQVSIEQAKQILKNRAFKSITYQKENGEISNYHRGQWRVRRDLLIGAKAPEPYKNWSDLDEKTNSLVFWNQKEGEDKTQFRRFKLKNIKEIRADNDTYYIKNKGLIPNFADLKSISSQARRLLWEENIPIIRTEEGESAFYRFPQRRIELEKNAGPEVLLHEFGHASNYFPRKKLNLATSQLGLSRLASRGKLKVNEMLLMPFGVPYATRQESSLLQILEEKRANSAALSFIKERKGNKKLQSEYIDAITPFFETYLKNYHEEYGKLQTLPHLNKGLIPNFNSVTDAIVRERAAGIPMSSIRVGQDRSLISNVNPAGLGVFNTKDEPHGLKQGITRAISQGINPKVYGTTNRGVIPNFSYGDDVAEAKRKYAIARTKDFGVTKLQSAFEDMQKTVRTTNFHLKGAFEDMQKTVRTTNFGLKSAFENLPKTLRVTNFGAKSSFEQARPIRYPFIPRPGKQLLLENTKQIVPYIDVESELIYPQKLLTYPSKKPMPKVGSRFVPPRKTPPTGFSDPNLNLNSRHLTGNYHTLENQYTFDFLPKTRPVKIGDSIVNVPVPDQPEFVGIVAHAESQRVAAANKFPSLTPTLPRIPRPFTQNVSASSFSYILASLANLVKFSSTTLPTTLEGLGKSAENVFSGGGARKRLTELSATDESARVIRDRSASIRAQRQQSLAITSSFVVPMVASTLSELTFDKKTKQSRTGAATVSGLGDVASFAALGASIGTIGGAPGWAVGAAIGGTIGLTKVFQEWNNILPEFTRRLEQSTDRLNLLSENIQSVAQTTEILRSAKAGDINLSGEKQSELLAAAAIRISSFSPKSQQGLLESIESGNRDQQNEYFSKLLKQEEADNNLKKLSERFITSSEKGNSMDGIADLLLKLRSKSGTSFANSLSEQEIRKQLFNIELPTGQTSAGPIKSKANIRGAMSVGEKSKGIKPFLDVLRENLDVDRESLDHLIEAIEKNFAKSPEKTSGVITDILRRTRRIKELTADLKKKSLNAFDPQKELENLGRRLQRKSVETSVLGQNFLTETESNFITQRAVQLSSFEGRRSILTPKQSIQEQTEINLSSIADQRKISETEINKNFAEQISSALAQIPANFKTVLKDDFSSFEEVFNNIANAAKNIATNTPGAVEALDEYEKSLIDLPKNLATKRAGVTSTVGAEVIEKQISPLTDAIAAAKSRRAGSLRDIEVKSRASEISEKERGKGEITNINYIQRARIASNNFLDSLNEDSLKASHKAEREILKLKKASNFERFSAEKTLNFQRNFLPQNPLAQLEFETSQAGIKKNQQADIRAIRKQSGESVFQSLNSLINGDLNVVQQNKLKASLENLKIIGTDILTNKPGSFAELQTFKNNLSPLIDRENGDNGDAVLAQKVTELRREITTILENTKTSEERINFAVKEQLEIAQAELRERTDYLSKLRARAETNFKAGRFTSGEDLQRAVALENEDKIRSGNYKPGDATNSFFAQFKRNSIDFYRDLEHGAIELGQTMKSAFKDAFMSFATGAKGAKDALKDFGFNILNKIIERTSGMAIDNLFSVLGASAQNIGSAIFSSKKATGGIVGYSTGGKVSGGSGFRDDVPAMLSKGEYVISSRAASAIGYDNLNKINSGIPPERISLEDIDTGTEAKTTITPLSSGIDLNLRNALAYDNTKHPTKATYNIDPLLSSYALEEDNNPQNALRFARENEFESYMREKAAFKEAKAAALRDFKTSNRRRMTAAYISTAVQVGSAYAARGLSNVNFSSISNTTTGVTTAKSSNGFIMKGSNSYKSFGNLNDTEAMTALKYGKSLGGEIRGYSYGGKVEMFGGQSPRDTIPAMLMGGEYVIKENVVKRLGKPFFDRLNTGRVKGLAEGGYVDSGPIIPSFSSSTRTVNQDNNSNLNDIVLKLATSIESLKNSLSEISTPKQNKDSGINNYVTISVNVDKTGQASSESSISTTSNQKDKNEKDDNNEKAKNLAKGMEQMILKTLVEQQRPGGLLYGK